MIVKASEKEQLSIDIRFYDDNIKIISEDFLGFVELNIIDAKTCFHN